MGGFKAVEDRPTPREVYNRRLYYDALVISFGALLFGYDSAFFGTTIARKGFKDAFGITAMSAEEARMTSSNITSTFQAAAFFGALFCWFLTEKIGRKWALQVNNVIFLIGAIIMSFITNLGAIYAGRALTGFACGGITATVPAYIAELSVPSIRGILTGFFEISYQLGSLVGFWINFGISNSKTIGPNSVNAWRIPMAVQIIPAGMLLIGLIWVHESPLQLIRAGKTEQAYKTLEYLRGIPVDHQYLQEEIEGINNRILEEKSVTGNRPGMWNYVKGAFKQLALPGMRNRVGLIFMLFLLQNFSGAAAINYYSPTLFRSIGITDVNLYTGIYGLVKCIGSICFYIFFIDMVGRRQPTIVSSIGCACCLAFVGAYVKIGDPATKIAAGQPLSASNLAGGKAATAMLMIYSVFWSFGLNGIPWIVSAEIMPGGLRSVTGTFAAMCQWITQFAITQSLNKMFVAMGFGVWFFFTGVLTSTAVWAYFFLPETKGLDLLALDRLFGYHSKTDMEMGQERQVPADFYDKKRDEDIHREDVNDKY